MYFSIAFASASVMMPSAKAPSTYLFKSSTASLALLAESFAAEISLLTSAHSSKFSNPDEPEANLIFPPISSLTRSK